MNKLQEKREALEALRVKQAKVFEEAGEDYDFEKVTSIDGDTSAKAKQVKDWNDEMTALGKEIDELRELESMKERSAKLGEVEDHPGHATKGKSASQLVEEQLKALGLMFVESDALKGWRRGAIEGPTVDLDLSVEDLKTVFADLGRLGAVRRPRLPKVVDLATRPIGVVDLFPKSETTSASIVYMEETTFTNAAVEVAEGAAKPEATLALTERHGAGAEDRRLPPGHRRAARGRAAGARLRQQPARLHGAGSASTRSSSSATAPRRTSRASSTAPGSRRRRRAPTRRRTRSTRR